LASEMRMGLIWGRGDPIGAGYAGVEVLGGRGPRLWSPRSWSPPHLRPPLVHRCPPPTDFTRSPAHLFVVHSTPLGLGLCSLDLVWCLFTLVRPHVPSVYPFALVLFAPAAAVPAVCAAAHMCALVLALCSCVPLPCAHLFCL
jgi:hypothetical protein